MNEHVPTEHIMTAVLGHFNYLHITQNFKLLSSRAARNFHEGGYSQGL